MKGFALILLCIVAAAQARSTAVQNSGRSVAHLGENPWLVHLRIAVSTSGFLNSCVGSLIDQSWVLTAAECISDSRFIWIRYGVVNVISPELVTEASAVRFDADTNVGLINIRRVVHSTHNIAPVALATSVEEVFAAKFCAFGEEDGAAGELLNCYFVELLLHDDSYVALSEEGEATKFDLGAPLVVDGQQIGILTAAASGDNAGSFTPVARVLEWIVETIEQEN